MPAALRSRMVQRRLVFAALALVCSACGRDISSPRAATASGVRIAASISRQASPSTDFNRVRVVFRRAIGGATALDTTVSFNSASSSASLQFSIALSPDATPAGELLTVVLDCINASGDTVYRGGPALALLSPLNLSPPVVVVLQPVGSSPPPIVLVPTVITAIAGDGLSAAVGLVLGTPLRALVVDQFGNPMPGLTVAWSVAAGGGVLGSATSVTDATGVATNTLRLGLLPGLNQVNATTGGLAPAIFRITGLLGSGSGGG